MTDAFGRPGVYLTLGGQNRRTATARAALADATARLRDAGVDSARVDAELLLAHCLGVERSRLSTVDGVDEAAGRDFFALVERRAAREPLQHICGSAPFRYLDVAVGPGVFVPRPETESLVDAVLPALTSLTAPVVVDLCAGTGAIALSIASEVPGAAVYAVELLPDALAWLKRNAGTEITAIAGDVTDPSLLAQLRGRVDAVVSNPPYVPLGTSVEPEVRADPAEAVFGGADGMALIPDVIARAAALLRPGGVLAVEHDATHGEAVPRLLRDGRLWRDVADHRDLAGQPRYATAVRGLSRPAAGWPRVDAL
ncbi:MAG TPA: peptide chain release factor N(5)-glutamine methyltransferase [Jatrophihabitantaceae bacterium]|nr:peptide chain release factor N(5)-glutamine methyltransferase [Jatrophihabitantaceae bacterium]